MVNLAAIRHLSILTTPSGRNDLLQRRCACGGTPGPSGECEACRQKREAATLQRAASHAAVNPVVPPIVLEVLRSPGQPLEAATRAQLEPRFGPRKLQRGHDQDGLLMQLQRG